MDGNATDDTLYFGGLNIRAKHTTNYAASGDAYQASTAGVAGGSAQNTVTTNTTAEVGTHLIINSAGGDMDVIANDIVNQAGGGARSGSGGMFSGAAALSNSTVTQTVTTNIDAGTVLSLNADPRTTTGVINIEAYNTLNTNDTVSLATASFFAGGGAESDMTANATLTGQHQCPRALQRRQDLCRHGREDGGGQQRQRQSLRRDRRRRRQHQQLGSRQPGRQSSADNAKVEAWGDITIYAGLAGDGSVFSSVQATATTVVYNNTAIPISTLYRGTANADDTTSLTLANTSSVLGVQNIFLGATQGQVTASGNGSNYNPYLDIFSAKNSDNHSHTSGTGDVALNGLVVAGINDDVTITIELGATTPTLSTTSLLLVADQRRRVCPRIRLRRQSLQSGDELEPPDGSVHRRLQLQSLPADRQPARDADRPDRGANPLPARDVNDREPGHDVALRHRSDRRHPAPDQHVDPAGALYDRCCEATPSRSATCWCPPATSRSWRRS